MKMLEYKSGRLIFLNSIKVKKREYFVVKCECGNIKEVRKDSFNSNKTKSCGCLLKEVATTQGKINFTSHGIYGSELYKIWSNAKDRCYRKNNNRYYRYGALGITMCDEWKGNVLHFYKWAINNGYVVGLSLERKDLNKGYDPNNCIWISKHTQAKNKNNTYKILIGNEYRTLKEYSFLKGFSLSSLYHFVKNNNIPKIIEEETFLRQYLAKPRAKVLGRCND